MRPFVRHLGAFTMVATLTACAADAPAPTALPDTPLFAATSGGQEQNIVVPLSGAVFVPCANGGTGEAVAYSGSLHLRTDVLTDGNGGFHVRTHANPQGVSGTGSVTGDRYQGTGVTRSLANVAAASTTSFVNNFRFIGQGTGNNFSTHVNTQLTVNANGEVTASVNNVSASCD